MISDLSLELRSSYCQDYTTVRTEESLILIQDGMESQEDSSRERQDGMESEGSSRERQVGMEIAGIEEVLRNRYGDQPDYSERLDHLSDCLTELEQLRAEKKRAEEDVVLSELKQFREYKKKRQEEDRTELEELREFKRKKDEEEKKELLELREYKRKKEQEDLNESLLMESLLDQEEDSGNQSQSLLVEAEEEDSSSSLQPGASRIQSQSVPFFEDSTRTEDEISNDENFRQSQSLLLKNEDVDEQDKPGYPFFFDEDDLFCPCKKDDEDCIESQTPNSLEDCIESETPNSESLLVQFARNLRYLKRKWIIDVLDVWMEAVRTSYGLWRLWDLLFCSFFIFIVRPNR